MTAECELSHENRVGEQKSQNQVNNYESRAAIASSLRRKPPYISESDGGTRCRHDESKP
jgi:hypothetical protein